MQNAGWAELWHMALALLARQVPFVQILVVTLLVLCALMTVEGFRASFFSRRSRVSPAAAPARQMPEETTVIAAPPPLPPSIAEPAVTEAPAPAAKTCSPSRRAVPPSRRPKPSASNPRQFSSPRPTIRRHTG